MTVDFHNRTWLMEGGTMAGFQGYEASREVWSSSNGLTWERGDGPGRLVLPVDEGQD